VGRPGTGGNRPAQLTGQEASDLFAFFFAAGYFETPGDARRGRLVFRGKRCVACHGIQTPIREGIHPVAAWQALENPISLAQEMWNHSGEMRQALDRGQIPYPRLSSQELTDMLVYLRGVAGPRPRAAEFSPASAETGQVLFASKGCAGCHRGSLSLESRHTRYSLTDFGAAMWNHAFQSAQSPAPLSYPEMRRLVGYLISTQFSRSGEIRSEARRFLRGSVAAPATTTPPAARRPGHTGRKNDLLRHAGRVVEARAGHARPHAAGRSAVAALRGHRDGGSHRLPPRPGVSNNGRARVRDSVGVE